MNEEQRNEIKSAIEKILAEYNVTTGEDFNSLEEEAGLEVYEDLKVGVLEEYGLDDDEMGELLDEVLGVYPEE